MNITNICGAFPDAIIRDIKRSLEHSRFTVGELRETDRPKGIIITQVRLRSRKLFCGAHPAACNGPERTHRKHSFLEGADWVEFNDFINNILDRLLVSAMFTSSSQEFKGKMYLRKGAHRRCSYEHIYLPGAGPRANAVWEADSKYPQHWTIGFGKDVPPSEFDPETPGNYAAANHNVVG